MSAAPCAPGAGLSWLPDESDELCAVCGRRPHPVDDPGCMPATKPVAEQLAWALGEITRLRSRLALATAALVYYRDECSGAEPSISVFHQMLETALTAHEEIQR